MHVPLPTAILTRQWRNYTCAVSTFRLVVHSLTRWGYSERAAMEVLGTTRDGTDFSAVFRELRDPSYGLRVTKFREVSRTRINRELAAGALVVCAHDQPGLDYGHIITVIADLGNRYKVVDPGWGWPTKRDKRRVVRMARGEAFAVRGGG